MTFDEWVKNQDYRHDGVLAMVAREAWHCCVVNNKGDEELRQQNTKRGARMQLMREWMGNDMTGDSDYPTALSCFLADHEEAKTWFDKDGVPK